MKKASWAAPVSKEEDRRSPAVTRKGSWDLAADASRRVKATCTGGDSKEGESWRESSGLRRDLQSPSSTLILEIQRLQRRRGEMSKGDPKSPLGSFDDAVFWGNWRTSYQECDINSRDVQSDCEAPNQFMSLH